MGIELDILIGHPEHDILFIATQVARAAGLKNPSHAVSNFKRVMDEKESFLALEKAIGTYQEMIGCIPKADNGRAYHPATNMFTEGQTYQMLLRGHAPASEPFRKWVTEVVLPTIRKTGKFDVNEATDETSQAFAGEFASIMDNIMQRNYDARRSWPTDKP